MTVRTSLSTKIRRNLHWGRTHGWANLLEEHDLQPTVRARRLATALRWRASNPPPTSVTTTFVVGAQRSGTNMMVYGLGNAPEVVMYNEGDRRAYRGFALRSDQRVAELVAASRYPHVVFKPLLDSHRILDLLSMPALDGPTRAVWAYRDVDGRVRSYLAKFGEINLRVMQAFARGGARDHWQTQGVEEADEVWVSSLDVDRMTPESGAALFWYLRNRLYFTLGLDRRDDVRLARYGDFTRDPEAAMSELCAFLGLTYRPALVAHIERRPAATRAPLEIDPAIRERCESLSAQLDEAARAERVE